ncbi:MAG: LysR family transcriptional regulator [Bradyrhizobiaceae bacterium]|nr:MAG: LysR family transcriptional regulator [Bradyrhizobiaceae bacterium]
MKLESLRYFHVARQCGSIRKAAERLHVAASAVSRQIAILEREVGLPLFERTATGVATTAAGEVLARHTRSMFREIDRARSAIEDLKGLRAGEVVIYAIEGMVSEVLPRLLSSFHARFPGISFKLVFAPTDRIVEAVLSDEADIGITFNARPRPELAIVARYAEPLSCLVSPSHPLACSESVSLQHLKSYPVALPTNAFGLRQLIDLAAKRRGISLQPMLTTDSLELTKQLAAAGVAVAFMPAFTVAREIRAGSLRCLPLDEKAFRSVGTEVCVHRNRTISTAAQEFLKALVPVVKALGQARQAF